MPGIFWGRDRPDRAGPGAVPAGMALNGRR